MRVKLDENIPIRVARVLAELGHDVDTMVDEGMKGQDDDQIWPASRSARSFFITKDLDFSDERRYPAGQHEGILILRLSDDRSRVVARRIGLVFTSEPVTSWSGCLVIVSDHKVRIRRPR